MVLCIGRHLYAPTSLRIGERKKHLATQISELKKQDMKPQHARELRGKVFYVDVSMDWIQCVLYVRLISYLTEPDV